MTMTAPMVLPADVLLVPILELPPQVREQVLSQDSDYALTRPRARTPSKIVDADAAGFLGQFRTPKTIVDAVISYSRTHKLDPTALLAEAYPLLCDLLQARLLVSADSKDAAQIAPTYASGDQIQQYEVVRCLQVLEDTELYQVRIGTGEPAALKLLRQERNPAARQMIRREATLLQSLDGRVNPRLLASSEQESQPFLLIEWCSGVDAASAADELRGDTHPDRNGLLALGMSILRAYAHLHSQQVIHGDVHPRNILVDSDGTIQIIDYGLARRSDDPGELGQAPRGGIGFFYEPEYANAYLANATPPPATMQGEQFALAALLYLLFSGRHYLNFEVEKDKLFHQIVEQEPLAFAAYGLEPWPEVEPLLQRALSKQPEQRFASVAAFTDALHSAAGLANRSTLGQSAKTTSTEIGKALALLDTILQRVRVDGPLFAAGVAPAPTASLNYGAAGIAYALYRIAGLKDDGQLLTAADLWVSRALAASAQEAAFYNEAIEITPETVGRISPYHTRSGVHAIAALIAHAMGDVVSHQAALDAFIGASSLPCANLDLTLGRSGTLLACSLLLEAIPPGGMVDAARLVEAGNSTMASIWHELDPYAAAGEAKELTNLGIAHGWAGVLYATLRWSSCSGLPLPADLEERLHQLATHAEPTGRGVRWPWVIDAHARSSAPYAMPGWCNGSAGFVFLWTLAHRTFGDDTYLMLAEKSAWNAWEEIENGASLCCGLAGRAYALLNLYKHTGERAWLLRAQTFANRAALVGNESEALGNSLYKGELGVALLAADLLQPATASMPFFEEENW